MLKSPESTDWSSAAEQLLWFNHFKLSNPVGQQGLDFKQFQKFLQATIYTYFDQIPSELARDSSDLPASKFTDQQELHLFEVFDFKRDHLIDREEFSRLCHSWLGKTFHRSSALVIVDVQNDFIDGSLALINSPAGQDGAEVVPTINTILDRCPFDAVVYTQDWHPIDHIGFLENIHLRKYSIKSESNSNNNNLKSKNENTGISESSSSRFKLKKLVREAKLFDTVLFDEGRLEQKLWPVHCVKNSWGAELHPKLKVVPDAIRVFKGTLSNVDAYSAFWDNMRLNETGLRQELISRKVDDVFFCGLALDYCVAASALDSARSGFMTFVIEDACRGIDNESIDKRKSEMMANGIFIINSHIIYSYLSTATSQGVNGQYRNKPEIGTGGGISKISDSRLVDRPFLLNICYKRALLLT